MNKGDMAIKVAKECKLSRYKAEKALNSIIKNIIKACDNGEDVVFAGFGKFEQYTSRARVQTIGFSGKTVHVPAKQYFKFRPSDKIKKVVQS